jgi:hypothetical protein
MSIALNLQSTEMAESCRWKKLTEPLVDIAASWILICAASCIMPARNCVIPPLTTGIQPASSRQKWLLVNSLSAGR